MDFGTQLPIDFEARVSKRLTPEDRLTLSIPETAKLLGISRALAYDLVRRGELPALRLGRRRLVPRAALDALLEGRSR